MRSEMLHRAKSQAVLALAFMFAAGSPELAQARQLTSCDCVSQAVQMRYLQQVTPEGLRTTHWGDFVPASQISTAALTSPFPPVNGVTSAFASKCGGPWVQGAADFNVWGAPLATHEFAGLGQMIYYEHDANGQWSWVTRTNCDEYWSPRYPLNMDMRFGAAAGDYGPRKLDLEASSAPLVSAQGQPYGWPTSLTERSLIGENLDMVTGAPLLQETDFVLPFGNASFRWQRTYSETPGRSRHEYDRLPLYYSARLHTFNPSGEWWDWAGQGWMLGVAPLLLIDASNWGSSEQVGEPRCYFLPDAHQSVPFILQGFGGPPQATRVYTAPPRFGMVLGYSADGVGTVGNGWTKRPDEWYVWTNHGSLRYTFAPVYDDVGPETPARTAGDLEAADPESTPPGDLVGNPVHFDEGHSLGMPRYAVLKRIDDLNGNRVDLEYTPFIRKQLNATGLPTPEGCVEMLQQSQMKGQIKRVRLLSGLTTAQANVDTPASLANTNITVAWTIVPVYRAFGGSDTRYDPHSWSVGLAGHSAGSYEGSGIYSVLDPTLPADRFEAQHALDSVYVYRFNYDIPTSDTGRPYLDQTLPHSAFAAYGNQTFTTRAQRAAALLAISQIDAAQECHLADTWEYRVRYLYADGTNLFNQGCSLLQYDRPFGADNDGYPFVWGNCPPLQSPRLLLTTTTHKNKITQTNQNLGGTTRHRMYRYLAQYVRDGTGGAAATDVPLDIWSLQGAWSSDRLESVKDVILKRTNWPDQSLVLQDWPLGLMLKRASGNNDVDEIPVEPTQGELPNVVKPLLYSADRVLEPWDSGEAGYSVQPQQPTLLGSAFGTEMLQQYIQQYSDLGSVTPLLDRDGTSVYTERTNGQDGAVYRVYRFMLLPNSYLQGLPSGVFSGTTGEMGVLNHHIALLRTHLHHPYLVLPADWYIGAGQPLTEKHVPGLANPLWAVVVDAHDSWDNAAWSKFLDPQNPNHGDPVWTSIAAARQSGDPKLIKRIPTSRRLVLMNAAGTVVYDRHWILAGFGAGSGSSSGLWEQRIYDWHPDSGVSPENALGRLIQVRTVGVAAAADPQNNTSPAVSGLIRVFKYDDRPEFAKSMEIAAFGNKQGTGSGIYSNVQWQRQLIRDLDRHDMVKYDISFTRPDCSLYNFTQTFTASQVADPDPTNHGINITFRGYTYDDLPQPDGTTQKRIRREVTIKPPAPAPGGADMYPVEITQFDYDRAPFMDVWHGKGALPAASAQTLINGGAVSTSGAQNFYADFQRSDDMGRTVFTCVDAGAIFSPPDYFFPATGFISHPPVRPSGWDRQPPESTTPPVVSALNQWLATDFCTLGPWRVENNHKAGDFYVYRYQPHPDPAYTGDALATRIYKGAVFDQSGNITALNSPGQITFHGEGGPPEYYGWGPHHPLTLNMKILSQEVNWTSTWVNLPSGTEQYTVLRDLDLATNGDGAPTDIKVHPPGSGESREVHIAYTDLGEVQRQQHPDGTITRNVYDPLGKLLRVYRGTNDVHVYWGTAEPPTEDPCAATYADNLVLLEKRAYGTAPENALQLVTTRTYRDKPTDQYQLCSSATHNEDSLGWVTTQSYDWKMRSVATTHYLSGSSTPALTTATYLDGNDRVRFVATFAGGLPASGPGNPTLAGPSTPVPTAAQILAAGAVRLSETWFNPRGLAEGQLEYDPSITDGSAYLLSYTYYDYADRPIRVIHPGGGETRTEYNANGQTVAESTWAAGVEVSRTRYTFDDDGNAAIITTAERVNPTGTSLDSGNSVTSYTYKWFDSQKRPTAVAELGTGSLAAGVPAAQQDAYTSDLGNAQIPARPTISPAPDPNAPSQLIIVNRQGLPDWVKITVYGYNQQGQESLVVNPRGVVTHNIYNAFGELVCRRENDQVETANDPLGRHMTVYKYDMGRLVKIGALLDPLHTEDWETASGAAQITQILYSDPDEPAATGAEVVNTDGNSFSPHNYNNGWVREVRFPDPTTGQPSAANSLKFKYFITGEIAQRTDQQGTVIKYRYDEAGRMTQYTVNTAANPTAPGGALQDRIAMSRFVFDPLGQLTKATAWKSMANWGTNPPAADIIAENAFHHDSHGNLEYDRQQHGGVAVATSPETTYHWDWRSATQSGVNNLNRLLSMTYPSANAAGTLRRLLTFEYGDHSGADFGHSNSDDTLGRMTGILSTGAFGNAAVARYDYGGSGRRIASRLGEVLSGSQQTSIVAKQGFHSSGFGSVGLDGLDCFGRTRDLWWTGPAGQTQQRVRTGYDQNDNPLYKLVTQATWGTLSRDNIRSFSFGYDKLDRLIKSDTGQLNAAHTDIETTGSVPMPVLAAWNLGIVDSWNGTSALPGLMRQGDLAGTGTWSSLSTTHATDQTNQINTVTTSTGTGQQTVATIKYDAAGNLILDNNYFYQYDGLNRLVQVSQQGTVTYAPGAGGGPGTYSGSPGNWLIQYAYDGLGRLIRAQRPWPQPGTALVRIEHYYYDGVRRLQEVFVDPLEDTDTGTKGVNSKEETDTPAPVIQYLTWTAREYIWGADYVDELVAQVAPGSAGMGSGEVILYALTGHAGTVTALLDTAGNVQAQYSYDPYGELLATDVNSAMPRNRLGHQGLFFDRLNGNVMDQQLGKGFVGTYYNRNRTYAPALGRFLQRDPNGGGQPLVSPPMRDSYSITTFSGVDLREQYADGANVYQYLGGNPVPRRDSLGLSWDPFEAAEQLEILHSISGFFAIAKIDAYMRDKQVLRKIRAYERGAFEMMDMFWDRDVGILFSVIAGPFFSHICFTEGTVVATPDGPQAIETVTLGQSVLSREDPERGQVGLMPIQSTDESVQKVLMRMSHADGSSTAIALLRPTSQVVRARISRGSSISIDLPDLDLCGTATVLEIEPPSRVPAPRGPRVTGTFATDFATVIDLHLAGYKNPIGVTRRHPAFSLSRNSWIACEDLIPGERLRTLTGEALVECITSRPERTAVYNIEVSDQHTYFVGDAEVWVHNPCKLSPDVRPRGGATGLKGAQWPAVRRGEEIFVAASHGHARNLAAGGDGLTWAGKIKGFVLEGYVEFLDELGTAWKWLTK